jgi:hypothetical protein
VRVLVAGSKPANQVATRLYVKKCATCGWMVGGGLSPKKNVFAIYFGFFSAVLKTSALA